MQGLPVAPGVALGRACVVVAGGVAAPLAAANDSAAEERRLEAALAASREQLLALAGRLKAEGKVGEAAIFEAHAGMTGDVMIMKPLRKKVAEGLTAEAAVQEVANLFVQRLGENSRSAADLKDVAARVLNNLGGGPCQIAGGGILVARELAPSNVAGLSSGSILGLVTEKGGKTSHTALVAQAFGLPGVSGLNNLLTHVSDGDFLIIDGSTGEVIVNPTRETRDHYALVLAEQAREREELLALQHRPACTADGRRVELLANIAVADEAAAAMEKGSEGIGLFRTEFLFMNRREAPGEEEQYEAYARAVKGAAGATVTIRTIDLGGDKLTSLFGRQREDNPFLGWRAIRICLDRPELFRTQLRAILRAAALGPVRVMFPMVATVEEFRHAKSLLLEAKAELRERGVECPDYLPCGMMVEIPSAALMAGQFAPFADFFSVGTNDLTQYTLAADRGNDRVARLYDPMHPAVLRLLDMTVRAAHGGERKIPVCCCGAAAGRPETALLFLGLGVDALSMPAEMQAGMKKALLGADFETCTKAARAICDADSFETYKLRRAEWIVRFKNKD